MASAKGNALEWALALSRAPMERHALRQRVLPDGIDAVLGIAADAAPDLLEQAVRASGESPASVREAARFYVREILLFPTADAYRTLGVPRDAASATIKAHHRLLQHWLHPDRTTSADDAVFAARVNTAWNQLRNPDRRQAYDAALDAAETSAIASSVPHGAAVWSGLQPPPSDAPTRWRHRAPVIVFALASLVLGVLAWREQGQSPEGVDPASFDAIDAKAADSGIDEDPLPIRVPAGMQRPQDAFEPDAVPGAAIVETGHRARVPARSLRETVKLPASSSAAFPPAVATSVVAPRGVVASGASPRTVPAAVPAGDDAGAPRIAAATVGAADERALPPPANPATPAASGPPPATRLLPSPAQIDSARRTGQQLLRYMADRRRASPPIWNSPAVQSSADQLRGELPDIGARLRTGDPEWRIGQGMAVMTARLEGAHADAATVSADLVWREDQWLVVGLSLERSR